MCNGGEEEEAQPEPAPTPEPACPLCEDTGSYVPDAEVGSGYMPCPNGCDPLDEEE